MDAMTVFGGAIAGALTGVVGSMLAWWKKSGVDEERVRNLGNRLDERVESLNDRLEHHEQANERTQGEIVKDLKEAVQNIRECVTEFRVMSREQSVVNTMVAKTLDSVVTRQEAHAMQLAQLGVNVSGIQRDMDNLQRG